MFHKIGAPILRLQQMNNFTSFRWFSAPVQRTAIYAGSFDPPSSGHLDIIRRGVKLCDKLIVGIASNSAKK